MSVKTRRALKVAATLVAGGGLLAACGASHAAASGSATTAKAAAATASSSGGSGKVVTLTLATDLTQPIPGTNRLPWQDVWVPAFEKKYPDIHIKIVGDANSSADLALYDRIVAAEKAHQAPPVDMTDASILPELVTQGYGVAVTKAEVPRLSDVYSSQMALVRDEATPFRGSAVVLAYNSAEVHHPPKTIAALLQWIKAHPGKFTYCPPSSGGSGEGFVQDVVSQDVPSSQQKAFLTSYQPSLEAKWAKGFAELKALQPDIYRHGFYPKGNTAVLDLLANGSIWMAPVWSDQSHAALASGLLPKTTKFVQLSPPMPGSPSYVMVLKGSPHEKAAFTFVNYLLSHTEQDLVAKYMHGFPGVRWSDAPAGVRAEFTGIESGYGLNWDAQFTNDLASKWQAEVPGQ
jgi:putative spermidine/putrescine transport system substrate-binding protein